MFWGQLSLLPVGIPERLVVKEGQGLVFFGRAAMAFQWDKRTNSDGQVVRSKRQAHFKSNKILKCTVERRNFLKDNFVLKIIVGGLGGSVI